MYDKPFLIREPVSNNAFSFDKRPAAALYVAALRDGTIGDVKAGKEIVFEDFDDEGVLRSCKGLAEFVRTRLGKKPVYVFDNHNHAFAFWHLEMIRGTVKEGCTIIHIDRHKDSRDPGAYLRPGEALDENAVFGYTNTTLNVGNFIPPTLITGLAREVIIIDSEDAIDSFDFDGLAEHGGRGAGKRDLILDIDLDFFAPEMDYIGNEKKMSLIKKLADRAKMLTIATSPFFIEPVLALKYLAEIAEQNGIN